MLDYLVENIYNGIICDDENWPSTDWIKKSRIITNQELKNIKCCYTFIDALNLRDIKPELQSHICGPKELVQSFHTFVAEMKLDLHDKIYTDEEAILVDTFARVLCDTAIYLKHLQLEFTKEDLKIIGTRIYYHIKKIQNTRHGNKIVLYTDIYHDKLSTFVKESPNIRAVLLAHYLDDDIYASLPIGINHKLEHSTENNSCGEFIHFRAYRL